MHTVTSHLLVFNAQPTETVISRPYTLQNLGIIQKNCLLKRIWACKTVCLMRLLCWWAFGCLSPCAFDLHRWLATLLAAPRKGEQSFSLSLPVHSLSTASPLQCLLVAAGVCGCHKAPKSNCKGKISMTQW